MAGDARPAPEPIEKIGFWSGNRSTVDVETIETSLPRAKELADAQGLAMPMLGTYLRASEHELVERVMRVAAEVRGPQAAGGPSEL